MKNLKISIIFSFFFLFNLIAQDNVTSEVQDDTDSGKVLQKKVPLVEDVVKDEVSKDSDKKFKSKVESGRNGVEASDKAKSTEKSIESLGKKDAVGKVDKAVGSVEKDEEVNESETDELPEEKIGVRGNWVKKKGMVIGDL